MSDKCMVCGLEGKFVFLKKTSHGDSVYGCKNGHSQEVRPAGHMYDVDDIDISDIWDLVYGQHPKP